MTSSHQGVLPFDFESAGPRRAPDRAVPAADPRSADMFAPAEAPGVSRRPDTIAGSVTRILFANPETGYHVMRVRLDEGGAIVTFRGPSEAVAQGDRVEATGRWEHHARYGRQLSARFIRALVPTTGEEIRAFLASGGIKGVGKRSAEKLHAHHGPRLAEAMESETALMAAGITRKQAETIVAAWRVRTTQTEVVSFLQSLGLGPATADRVINRYGDKARMIVSTNPFRVAREVSGIGFRTADRMSLALGFDRCDARRIEAGVLSVMAEVSRDGHCATSRTRIEADVRALLTVPDTAVRDAVERMINSGALVVERGGSGEVVYEAGVRNCEIEVSEGLAARIAHAPLPEETDARIAHAATAIGIADLHAHQASAVRAALCARLAVITGGPGSGKTSSLEVFLRVFENTRDGARIELCAPTGRAAQRMSEATGRPARTIHRLLEWSPEKGGFQRDADNPIEADVVVIDEASMLDIWMTRDVLRAVPETCVLLLVGDVDQLPSVGPGRVLGDVIESGAVPVARLTRVFRQGEGSRIAQAAQKINAGEIPVMDAPSRGSDMWARFDAEPESSLARIVRLASEVAPSLGFDPLRDIQVLTAGHNGCLGTASLNHHLQEALNPCPDGAGEIRVGDRVFRVGDRVIQTANNYELDVFNGDIGQVVSFRRSGGGEIVVRFDARDVLFTGADMRALALAYAITVHKAQGSEFPFVVVAPATHHYTMLGRTMVYTAITRARRLCAVVGQERALRMAIKRTGRGRVTGLARRIAVAHAQRCRDTGQA